MYSACLLSHVRVRRFLLALALALALTLTVTLKLTPTPTLTPALTPTLTRCAASYSSVARGSATPHRRPGAVATRWRRRR